jgi:ATP-dependent protease ClpP protease subunit
MTGHIFLEGEIGNDVTVKTVRRDIAMYPQATEWIIHINSIGGDVYEGYQIGNIFKSLDNTTAHIGAMCASIATYAATCCNKVKMNVHGDFMIHLPTGTLSGNAEDLRRAAVQLDRIKSELINQYMTKVEGKITVEQLSNMIDVETSMSPQEALQYGFIDSVEEKLKAVAKLDIQKLKNMEVLTKEEAKGLFANLGEKIDNLFKKVRNSVELALADGT